MLPLPPFRLERPETLAELLPLAAEPGSRLLAGGTDLLPSLKHRLFSADCLVSLAGVQGLSSIEQTQGGLRIGATATLWDVADHPVVQERYPALAAACRTVATSTIQAMATLGGNVMLDVRCIYYNQPDGWRESIGGCLKCDGSICHVARTGSGCYAAHSADTVPVLWLLGAEIELVCSTGSRSVDLDALYGEDGIERLRTKPGEVLTAITLPAPTGRTVHRKLRLRGSIDYPALLVAVRREGAGATAVLSAIGPRPIAVQTERAEDLVEAAWAAAKPLNTHAISTPWRRQMVRVEVGRALIEAGT
jgi:4-hydroxybenzoyl-CoA reductase subunit beta